MKKREEYIELLNEYLEERIGSEEFCFKFANLFNNGSSVSLLDEAEEVLVNKLNLSVQFCLSNKEIDLKKVAAKTLFRFLNKSENETCRKTIVGLIKDLLKKNISVEHFCDDFIVVFGQKLNRSEFTEEEYLLLDDLDGVVSRYSPFKDDQENNSVVFYNDNDVIEKVRTTASFLGIN